MTSRTRTVGALAEPLPPTTARELRAATQAYARRTRADRATARLRIGRPSGSSFRCPVDVAPDQALAVDVVHALVRRWDREHAHEPLLWLSRPGTLTIEDGDLLWSRAVATVAGEAGRALAFVVVTRVGWLDPRSGASRRWTRLR